MITLSADQIGKIEILDRLFSNLDLDQLRQLSESELVVAKLRGGNDGSMILINLIREHDTLCIDIMDVKNQLIELKDAMQVLIRVLQNDVFTPRYSNDFQTLKSKYNVY